MPAPGLRDGDGAGIQDIDAVAQSAAGNVRVAVEQDVARMQGRQMVLVKMVAVRGIDEMARRLEQAVVRKNGEGQHHLVDLGLAVAAHAENVGLPLLQQGDDLLRRIALGQVVARAVIQQIAEEEHTRRFLTLPGLEELAAVVGRAVQVRGNDPFHGFFVPFRCNSPPIIPQMRQNGKEKPLGQQRTIAASAFAGSFFADLSVRKA